MPLARTPRAWLTIACASLVLASVHAQPARLLPVDEAATRPDFFSFRAGLQAALARRDTAAVLAVVDPAIRNTFGDDNGLDAFRRLWRPDAPDSRLWMELGTVLALGGSFTADGTFAAPYVFGRWPDRFDAYEHVALVAAEVRIREAPALDAPVMATRSFAILRRVADGAPEPSAAWIRVLVDGRPGFVAASLARSPIDYRALFARRAGGWRMVTFIAGD